MTYYHDNETDRFITEEDVKIGYELFKESDDMLAEYYTFSDYKSACMYWNNGSLKPIKEGYTQCRFRPPYCTETEQKYVYVIDSVNPETERIIIRCINSPLPIQPSETVAYYMIQTI